MKISDILKFNLPNDTTVAQAIGLSETRAKAICGAMDASMEIAFVRVFGAPHLCLESLNDSQLEKTRVMLVSFPKFVAEMYRDVEFECTSELAFIYTLAFQSWCAMVDDIGDDMNELLTEKVDLKMFFKIPFHHPINLN